MKTYDELQRKVMQETLSLRREFSETWEIQRKIQKKQKKIHNLRNPLAILLGAIVGITWMTLGVFSSLDDWYFVNELRWIPRYVITTGIVADIFTGFLLWLVIWAIAYGIISLFVPNDEKTKNQIRSIEKTIKEKCHLILKPVLLSLFEKTLDQFTIINKKNVIEDLRNEIKKIGLIEHVYADALRMNLYVFLSKNLVEYKNNQYILDLLEIESDIYPNKLGEHSFFVTCHVEKIENESENEKNFSLTEQTLVFQIDLE